MLPELHLELIEPVGVDEEDSVEDDIASDAEKDERFPGISIGERPSKERHNDRGHALESSIEGLDTRNIS